MTPGVPRVVWWAGACALLVLTAVFAIPPAVDAAFRACDFAAFYCAGEAVARGMDPYRVMPIAACEHRVATGPFFAALAVMPAPLPPYALAALRAVAGLPFALAQHLLDAASLAAFFGSAIILHRVTRVQWFTVLFVLAPAAWIVVMLGQPLLLLVLALVGCAALLHRGHERWAALAAATLMIEPHVGLAVCLSLFVWRKRARPVLLSIGAGLAVLAMATFPWPVLVEYFVTVLPLHARSEVFAPGQYGLGAILVPFGVDVTTALRLAAVQYALTMLAGIWVARALAERTGNVAALVFVPALFAVTGGTFVHATDFIIALPAALLIAGRTPRSVWVTLALIGLTAHWKAVGGLPAPILSILAATVIAYTRHRGLLPGLIAGAGVSLAVALCAGLPHGLPAPQSAHAAREIAEVAWTQLMSAHRAGAVDFLLRVPMWAGLLFLCGTAMHLTEGRPVSRRPRVAFAGSP